MREFKMRVGAAAQYVIGGSARDRGWNLEAGRVQSRLEFPRVSDCTHVLSRVLRSQLRIQAKSLADNIVLKERFLRLAGNSRPLS